MQDDFGTMDLHNKSRHQYESYPQLQAFQAVLCWVLGGLSIAACYEMLFPQFIPYFAVIMMLLAGAFLVSVFGKIYLLDLFNQLGYRGKFVIFAVIGTISFIPHGLMHTFELETQLLIWLIASALFSFNAIGHGRYYLASIVMFCVPILFRPLVTNALVLIYPIVLISVFWLDYILYRLQEHGSNQKPDLSAMIKGVMPALWISFGVGFAGFFFATWYYQGRIRVPVFDPGVANNSSGMGLSLLNQLWVDLFIIFASVTCLLVMLYYLEKKLRIKKKGETLIEETMDAVSEERFGLEVENEKALSSDQAISPSQRIILRFMQFARGLQKKGYARFVGETSSEFMKRLADKLLTRNDVDPLAYELFNEACYSPHAMTEEQADQFVQIADDIQPEMEAEVHRLIEREVYLQKLKSEQDAREQSN